MFDLVASIVMGTSLIIFAGAILYFVISDYIELKKETR